MRGANKTFAARSTLPEKRWLMFGFEWALRSLAQAMWGKRPQAALKDRCLLRCLFGQGLGPTSGCGGIECGFAAADEGGNDPVPNDLGGPG